MPRRTRRSTQREPVRHGAGSLASPPCPFVESEPIQQAKNQALTALSERQFQAIVRAGLEGRGFTVWVVPMMKLTTAGLPDILAWHPARPGLFLAWELKRERDFRVTPKQRAALAHLETVPGVDARIVRPSQWAALRDTLDVMLGRAPGCEGGLT